MRKTDPTYPTRVDELLVFKKVLTNKLKPIWDRFQALRSQKVTNKFYFWKKSISITKYPTASQIIIVSCKMMKLKIKKAFQ